MDFSDFNALYSDKPITVEISGPDKRVIIGDDGKPVTFDIYPPNAPCVEVARRKVQDRQQARSDDGELTQEERDAFTTEVLASLIAGWSQNWTLDGAALKYSPANAVKLLDAPGGGKLLRDFLLLWRYDQGNAWAAYRAQRQRSDDGAAASTKSAKARSTASKKS